IQQNQREEARRLLEAAEPHHHAALATEPRNTTYRLFFRNNRWVLAECLVELGDHGATSRAGEQWIKSAVDAKTDNYNAARCLARCVSAAQKDKELTGVQRQELVEKYSERAVALLKQAIVNGFQDVEAMKKDQVLAPLRERADFKKLLADLEGNAKFRGPRE